MERFYWSANIAMWAGATMTWYTDHSVTNGGFVICATHPPPPSPNLFFSQYQEGSGNNKFLQIYNPTSATIALSGYAFPSVTNAPTTPGTHERWNTFTAGATIAAGGFYTICHPSAAAGIRSSCDQTNPYLSNGDDGYCLAQGTERNPTILDCIGTFRRIRRAWNVCGSGSGTTTQNHHLLRDTATCWRRDRAAFMAPH